MKKWLILLAAVFLVSCGGDQRPRLFVYNVGEYMDTSVLEEFEEEYGVRVIYETFDSNETAYQKLKAGTTAYDVVFPSDYMIEKMIKEDMLEKLDFSLIPNFENLLPEFTYLEYDPKNLYSVPYFWGTVGIVYDTRLVNGSVDSWSALWDERYEKEIFMYDSQRDSLMVALKLLGYSLNTHKTEELEAAKSLLIKQSPFVIAYITDVVISNMIAGNAGLAVVYSGDAAYIMDENESMEYVIPKEGSNLWVDAMVIPKMSNNKELAHAFIDFILRPEIGLANTEYVMYSTPNALVLEELEGEGWTENDAFNPDLSKFPNLEMFKDPGEFVAEYDRIWIEILAGAK
ncbi:MAG: ABC transporter substrate-binding protein [Turicibacter sp.]|nr:ABC transporter substrate-binding protein [Turicibacter sp.]